MEKPEKHIFVCTSCRANGTQQGACIGKHSDAIVAEFLEKLEEYELTDTVMVSNTSCFGICTQGPVVVVYPDNVWYGNVTVDDVEEIVDSHISNGEVVERLVIS